MPLFLAEASGLPWTEILGAVATLLGTVGGAVKIVWGYWTKREAEKRAAWQKVVADKDLLIAAKDQSLANLRKEKDGVITELQKELSRKSDEHAAKIQELMGITIEKVEDLGQKTESLLDRALTTQAEFTAEVRRLRIQNGSGGS